VVDENIYNQYKDALKEHEEKLKGQIEDDYFQEE
jgi:hypothetical protein